MTFFSPYDLFSFINYQKEDALSACVYMCVAVIINGRRVREKTL